MNAPRNAPVSVQQADDELAGLMRTLLRMAAIGTAVVSPIGLVGLLAAPESNTPHVTVQAVLSIIAVLAAIRALFPGRAAYDQAAILLCWAVTLGQAFRAVMSFTLDLRDWVDAGYVPTFAAWVMLPLILNFLFLPLRQALILCCIFYVSTASAMLYTVHVAMDGGAIPFNLVSMVLFFVIAGVPIGIFMLGFLSHSVTRYHELARRIENDLRQQQSENELDDITGCLNRRGLLRRVEDVVAETQGLLAAIEIDNITRHLQILGGRGAHSMLTQLGQQLKLSAGEGALVARWDGGRFYVFMPRLEVEPMVAASQLLPASKNGATSGISGGITLSVGACVVAEGSVISDYLEEADLRLFLAQSAGGNCIRLEVGDAGSATK
jgi:GGDEF domain-containing protein